ncbi:MAG: nucleoside triphosphate pyrophosphohydrolase [Erysipelotrichaceae bacterium]|nr:nucleoside triphosphate pyrophosphohydrolase [Erysipelotrichaceae bacterium]
MKYNKLVRDRIPEIIENDGKTCVVETLNDQDYLSYLNNKLIEEVNEYLESGDIEELADLEEVLRAILDVKDIDYSTFEEVRLNKVEKRGTFKNKILLKEVSSNE